MKNSAFIRSSNDVGYTDIYTEYGVSFIKGSYIKLLNKGKTKKPVKNESRLENGVRIGAPTHLHMLSNRTVSLDIIMEANSMQQFVERYEAFTEKLCEGMIYLKIPSRYRVFKLVYNGITPKQEYRNKMATFTLEMEEPNPNDRDIIE